MTPGGARQPTYSRRSTRSSSITNQANGSSSLPECHPLQFVVRSNQSTAAAEPDGFHCQFPQKNTTRPDPSPKGPPALLRTGGFHQKRCTRRPDRRFAPERPTGPIRSLHHAETLSRQRPWGSARESIPSVPIFALGLSKSLVKRLADFHRYPPKWSALETPVCA